MKKRFLLLIVTAFMALLCGACLCGCGLFGGQPNDPPNNPNDGKEKPLIVQNVEYRFNADGRSYYASNLQNWNASSVTIVGEIEGLPVTKLADRLFAGCERLKTVTIEDGISVIGGAAFRECPALETLVIPSSVTTVGVNAFGIEDASSTKPDMPKPKTVTAPANVLPHIWTENLETLVINGGDTVTSRSEKGVTGAGLDYALKLKTVEIRDGVTEIANGAFGKCVALETISIPGGVKSIGEKAFQNCENLQYTEKDGGKYLGNTSNPYLVLAGVDDEITSFGVEDGTRLIYGAFNGRADVTSVELNDNIVCISNRAFGGCTGLTELVLPSTVESVGEYTFLSCNAIVAYCAAAEKPEGWDKNWNNRSDARRAEDYCPVVWNSRTNKADGDGYEYSTIDGVRYKFKDDKAVVACQSTAIGGDEESEGSIEIKRKVKYADEEYNVVGICDNAFLECRKLKRVEVNADLEYIGESAFHNCAKLMYIELPTSLIEIGKYAFRNCSALGSLYMPERVERVGEMAFLNCRRLIIYFHGTIAQRDLWESGWNANGATEIWDWRNNNRDRQGYIHTQSGSLRYGIFFSKAYVWEQPVSLNGTVFIPDTITYDGYEYDVDLVGRTYMFKGCEDLMHIYVSYKTYAAQAFYDWYGTLHFDGTKEQFFRKTAKGQLNYDEITVICTDGQVTSADDEARED